MGNPDHNERINLKLKFVEPFTQILTGLRPVELSFRQAVLAVDVSIAWTRNRFPDHGITCFS